MKLTAALTALSLLSAPALAAPFDHLTPTGTTSGPIGVDVAYDGGLFVDDSAFSELSLFLLLAGDGGFDPLDTTATDLLFFPSDEVTGQLVDIDYGTSAIHALFEVTSDSFAGSPWGDLVLATINLPGTIDWSVAVELSDLGDFTAPTQGTAELNAVAAVAVPLPATLPLMLGAFALAAGLRRARG